MNRKTMKENLFPTLQLFKNRYVFSLCEIINSSISLTCMLNKTNDTLYLEYFS